MLPSVIDLVKNQFVNKANSQEILSQKHLLSQQDLLATILLISSEKIAKIHCMDGLHYYFSTTKTTRKSMSIHTADFKKISQGEVKCNVPYDEAYLTYLRIEDEDYFIEHNDVLSETEISSLMANIQDCLTRKERTV